MLSHSDTCGTLIELPECHCSDFLHQAVKPTGLFGQSLEKIQTLLWSKVETKGVPASGDANTKLPQAPKPQQSQDHASTSTFPSLDASCKRGLHHRLNYRNCLSLGSVREPTTQTACMVQAPLRPEALYSQGKRRAYRGRSASESKRPRLSRLICLNMHHTQSPAICAVGVQCCLQAPEIGLGIV